jgi:TAT (twin-arginine translocation) pathway signal sequence
MSRPIHRRRFLQASAGAAAAAYFVNPTDASQPARNERVRVAIVGVNAQGAWNLDQVVGSGLAEIVALCDVDAARSAGQVRRFPRRGSTRTTAGCSTSSATSTRFSSRRRTTTTPRPR